MVVVDRLQTNSQVLRADSMLQEDHHFIDCQPEAASCPMTSAENRRFPNWRRRAILRHVLEISHTVRC